MWTWGPRGAASAPSACDPYLPYVVLLGFMEGANNSTTIAEEISGVDFGATGDAKLSTTSPVFGASSCEFDGSGDRLTHGFTTFSIHTNPYCIDVWIYPTNIAAGAQGIICNDVTVAGGSKNFNLIMTDDGGITFSGALGTFSFAAPAGTFSNNSWFHVAVSGDGAGSHRMFVDGVHVASGTSSSYSVPIDALSLNFGAHNPDFIGGGFDRYFYGRMKCPRITLGIDRFPGTTSFTPPSSLADYYSC